MQALMRGPLPYAGVFLADAALGALILWKIPYTEIDWVAYMQQIETIRGGQTDYQKISGQTGPLVYPGGHVMIFDWLYSFCDNGLNVPRAQLVFYAVYLFTLLGALLVYRKARVPWGFAALLILSKRLHSIYLLRLFNDCFAVLFAVYGVLCLQANLWTLTAALFSMAVSVKMSILLYMPGVAIVMWNALGVRAVFPAALFGAIQLLVLAPFADHWQSYLKGAFNLSRQFLYEWTVNWRFVPEETFKSMPFANSLLIAHVCLLALLAAKTLNKRSTPARNVKIVFIANLIGILCARSLHYQFYSWFYWTVPFLLQDTPGALKAVWLVLEWAWRTFPSTNASSFGHLVSLTIILACSIASL